ncbi:MvaI/BcnI restriction endonuclease family protein [Macrococcus brunensis]|uniref:MvaI/BcnI restriction endonuclease family protein n=1 Tax=Macrococcus brunensis TaxID=198483 RepID=A0A4R6BAM0_9STAP|nr:MvaI/BcnI family restriction endonuclease [Macrococcus brunensis]TDL93344.1 MvaI/BcnI restriction endonuclease family protein [Macrococcus brunensis]
MSEYLDMLKEAVQKIIDDGWHETKRTGNTGIGKTFEDLLEKEEDNLDAPDFHDIEIKTHETAAKSLLTLFTKSPTNPRGANTILRNKYGKKDEYGNNILHQTVSGNRLTKSNSYLYDFKVEVDWENEVVRLEVYDKSENMIDNSVYWSFESLQKQLDRKLKYIAIISAESKIENNTKYYKYNSADLLTGLSVESLCEGIENGDIKIDIRIGAYHSGKKIGKTHDHGTGFRINMEKLLEYGEVKVIL